MTNIYIVEDDTNILEIESYALKSSGYEIMGFENSSSFFKQLEKKVPNLILLDIMLPDEDGLSILKKLRKSPETEHIPIIMVTAKSTEIDTVKALDQGADDYITKPFGVMELISRVKALLRRSGNISKTEIISLEEIEIKPESRTCEVDGKLIDLTFKEYELLTLLLKNAGIVMKRDLLMDRIWGIDFDGESRTLDMHIKTLRQKLGDSGSHIHTVRNVGYIAK
ncbi:MAG: response regulator transcription factor [Lachnospiraceae bacterium]|nr:response regulator transcription factor [Lachnospiraceae bacterium]